jgi:hypothetical protein
MVDDDLLDILGRCRFEERRSELEDDPWIGREIVGLWTRVGCETRTLSTP